MTKNQEEVLCESARLLCKFAFKMPFFDTQELTGIHELEYSHMTQLKLT